MAERLAECLDIPAADRATFIQAARAELPIDRIHQPTAGLTQSRAVGSGAVVPPAPSEPAAPPPAALPTGTLTFLFTDIENSTGLWEQHGAAMAAALARHDAILRDAVAQHGGVVFKTVGDGICAAFASAIDALLAAVAAQRTLHRADWGMAGSLRVRMALHTGHVEMRNGDYVGLALSYVARILKIGHGGQTLLSRATQELVRDELPGNMTLRDLGAHQLKGLSQRPELFQLVAPDLPEAFAPLRTLDNRPNNLTIQPTSLHGRDAEVRDVVAALRRPEVRLLTLTGAPGIGKSRIGLQAAAELLESFEDGVFAINVTTTDTTVILLEAIGQALSVRDTVGPPLERLQRALRSRQLLLVLDNFERLIAAADAVVALLAAAPGLKILITSRAALRVSAEHELPVAPLPVPPLDPLPAFATLAANPAVDLFVTRTRSVRPDFNLTAQNAPVVAAICARLDGLPLAIELAAARGKLFPPPAMLARLERRLGLLTDGARDRPPHQRTLRGAIDWSYELLDPDDRRLFARLGVFACGCTIEAAEAVCTVAGRWETGVEGWEAKPDETAALADAPTPNSQLLTPILDGLTSLVDKSLLQQIDQPDGEPRFVMLETLREFALERLDAFGEAEDMRRRHATYFVELAESAEEPARGASQRAAVDRLRAEHDNLRAALQWALDHGAAELAIRLSGALGWFWDTRSYLSEGRRWLSAALAAGADVAPTYRAKALTSAGILAGHTDFEHARQLFDEGLALYRASGDRRGTAYALSYLGRMLRIKGDNPAAQEVLAEALAIFKQLGDGRGAAYTQYNLGRVLYQQGDDAAARQMFAASLARFRQAGDGWGQALVRCNLGRLAYRHGDLAEARSDYEAALALFEQIDDGWGQALARCKLGWVAYRQGDAAVQALFVDSMESFLRVEYAEGVADALTGIAALAHRAGEFERSARLFGAAARIRSTVDVLLTTDDADAAEWTAESRARLGAAAFERAWQGGQAAPQEDILNDARSTS
jgi:predicted ATPase/class 3 adenylate cyclase